MCSLKISKRSFIKSVGLLAILGMVAPWLKRGKDVGLMRDYPMDASKEPKAVARKGDNLI